MLVTELAFKLQIKGFLLFNCRGADPRGVNGEGKTPIELAMESKFEDGEVLALLRESKG